MQDIQIGLITHVFHVPIIVFELSLVQTRYIMLYMGATAIQVQKEKSIYCLVNLVVIMVQARRI